jgi:hypothetical protein
VHSVVGREIPSAGAATGDDSALELGLGNAITLAGYRQESPRQRHTRAQFRAQAR